MFGLIPALKNAEYMRFGVMHRNSFVNAPSSLDRFFRSRVRKDLFVAGQLGGVEGYVESIATGKFTALCMIRMLDGKELLPLPETTVLGALAAYISSPNENFQPMNANYGLLPPITPHIRDKQLRKQAMYERAVGAIKDYSESI